MKYRRIINGFVAVIASSILSVGMVPSASAVGADYTFNICDASLLPAYDFDEVINMSWDHVGSRPIFDFIVPVVPANGKCMVYSGTTNFLDYFELISSPNNTPWPTVFSYNWPGPGGNMSNVMNDPNAPALPPGTFRFQLKEDVYSTEDPVDVKIWAYDPDYGGAYGGTFSFNVEVSFPIPGQPGQPTVVRNANSFDVSWGAPSTNLEWVDYYEVRASVNGGSTKRACSVTAPATTCSVVSLAYGNILLDPAASYVFYVTAYNEGSDGGLQSLGSTSVSLLSTNSSATALEFKNGPTGNALDFTPSFTSGGLTYSASIDHELNSVALGVTPAAGASLNATVDTSATVTLNNGYFVVSNLPYGETEVTLTVTAEDGVTTTNYVFTITRETPPLSNDASLTYIDVNLESGAALQFSPTFSSSTYAYTASIPYSKDEISIDADPAVGGSVSITTNNGVTGIWAYSEWVYSDLPVGETIFTITITAEDGVTTNTYTFTVTRAPEPTEANLDPIDNEDNPNFPGGGISEGDYVFLVDGELVELVISPNQPSNGTALEIEAPGLTMSLEGRGQNQQATQLTENQALVLISKLTNSNVLSYSSVPFAVSNPTVFSSGTGFKANSIVKFYLLPGVELGTLQTDANGNYEGELEMPNNLEAGEYTLQVNGISPNGEVRSLSLGVLVRNPEPSAALKKLTKKILFAADSAKLTKKAKKILRKLVAKSGTDVESVISSGFVRKVNKTWNTKKLSQKRAEAVAKYLKKLGVEGSFTVKGKGQGGTSPASRKVILVIRYSE